MSSWDVNPRVAETRRVLMTVSEMSEHEPRSVLLQEQQEYEAYAIHEGCGTKLGSESNGVFEVPAELIMHNVRSENGNSGLFSSPSELEQIEE